MRPDFEKSEGDWHASVFSLSLIYEWIWCLGIDVDRHHLVRAVRRHYWRSFSWWLGLFALWALRG